MFRVGGTGGSSGSYHDLDYTGACQLRRSSAQFPVRQFENLSGTPPNLPPIYELFLQSICWYGRPESLGSILQHQR